MWCMAVHTGGVISMCAVQPTFILSVHYMTVVTRLGVTAKIDSKIGYVHANTYYDSQGGKTNNQGGFHLAFTIQDDLCS